jgi:DNA-binding MarR family transcriptional regulator
MAERRRTELPTPPDRGTYSLLFDVFVLEQRVGQLLETAMARSPLRPEDYAVYSVVFEEEAVSPTAMATELSMPLTTVVDYIRLMDSRGHCRRLPNPKDGRSYFITLTAAGRRAHREANLLFERAYQAFLAALPQGERAARSQIDQLLTAAEQAGVSLATGGARHS